MIRLTLISLTALSLLGAVIPIPTGPESAFTKTLKPLTNAPLWREALGISNLLGGSIFVTNVVINGTNAPQGNGTPPYLPVWVTTNVLGDSPVYQIDTNKVGVDEVWANALLVTNLQTGGIVLSLTPEGYATNLLRGVGFVYDDGVDITLRDITATTVITNLFVTNLTVLNFITVGGTNVAVVNPSDNYLPVRASTNAFADSPLHIPSAGSTNIIVDGQVVWTAGNAVANSFVRGTNTLNYTNNSVSGTVGPGFVVIDGSGRFASLRANGTVAEVAGVQAVDLNSTAALVRLGSTTFSPFTEGIALGTLNGTSLPWGNVVSRGTIYNFGFPATGGSSSGIGTDYSRLAITHTGTNGAIVLDSQSLGSAGAARPFVLQQGTIANSLTIGTNSAGQMTVIADNGSTGFVLWNGGLVPPGGSVVDLGGPSWSQPWHDLGLDGQMMLQGFKSGVDYSRLIADHTGTNGVISFDSQASGSAGAARPFTWATNGVMIAKLQENEFLLTNSATATVGSMRITSGGHTLLLAGTSGDLFFGVNNNGSGNLILTSTGLVPATDGGLALGSGANGYNSITLNGITKVQKTALTPSDGMIVYQTDNTPGLRAYVNGAWVMVSTVADP